MGSHTHEYSYGPRTKNPSNSLNKYYTGINMQNPHLSQVYEESAEAVGITAIGSLFLISLRREQILHFYPGQN